MAVIPRAAASLVRARAVLGLLLAGVGCGGAPLDLVTIDPSNLTRGLMAHWTFDDGSGMAVRDSSGNGRDGVLTGGTWRADGRFGGGLSLASGNSVAVAGFPQATASWTVSTWMRASATELAADAGDLSTIISTETVFAGGWQIYLDNRPNYQRFAAAYWSGPNTTDYVVVLCPCVVPDQWIHLTVVWDGDNASGKMSLYHDDQKVDELPMPTHILTGDSTLRMGTWNMANRYLVGEIDDFAVWSRALNAAEIASLSRRPPGM